jgi:hypothetical protein
MISHSCRMKPWTIWIALTIVLTTLTGFVTARFRTGDEIMKEVKNRHTAETEVELIKMITLDNQGNAQEREFISLIRQDDKGNFSYLIRFFSPQDVRGVTLLTLEKPNGEFEQYLHLPALGQTRKVVGSQRSQSFMGSDFTFEDLRKEQPEEYVYNRLLDEKVEGRDCYVIMSAPKDANKLKATGFSNRILFIDKEDFNILKVEFFDSNRELIKTFQGFDYNSVEVDGPSKRPRRAVMTNRNKGSTSILALQKSRLNVPLNNDWFSVKKLDSWDAQTDEELLALFNK